MGDEFDIKFMHRAIALAQSARENRNHPFGALLIDANGNILQEAENTVVTEQDCTAHAETNLMRMASKKYSPEELQNCTLYTSTEPCPMCAGAIFWGNIGRVVYGLSEEGLYAEVGETPYKLLLSCRDIFARGSHPIEVTGPILEEDALQVHRGFWQ